MSFSELESVRNLTAKVYSRLIANDTDKDSAESYRKEGDNYLEILDDIIEQRMVMFLDTH